MHRIVLIDGFVDRDKLKHPERIGDVALPSGLKATSIGWSHATTIARILENLTDNYILDNYAILQVDNSANIQHLMHGLEYCIEKRPDIVIISLGSAQPVDGLDMYPLVRLLRNTGCVIFVAQSNNCLLTFPASFSEVITVQRDYCVGLYPEYEYEYLPCWMQINIKTDLHGQVAIYETFCDCELLLFHIPLKYLSRVVDQVNMDVLIRKGSCGSMVWKAENFIKRCSSKSVAQTANKIYELLT